MCAGAANPVCEAACRRRRISLHCSTLQSEPRKSTIPTTGTVTFTIKSVPLTDGGFRTVERLMRLERGKQRTLKKLQKTRVNELNERRPRAGRMWLVRARCTRLVRVAAGESFTIQVTPQIAKDLASVAKHLDFKKVG